MLSDEVHESTLASAVFPDDLSRQVYCILGMPIDAVEMPAVLSRIETAVAKSMPFAVSTPNLNFLVTSQSDADFRETLLLGDLCPADGMPIVWIARLIGVPIRRRIAGSDIFDALKSRRTPADPLKVFFFGGADGAAAAASRALNAEPGGMRCVGSLNPGFGTVEDMSRRDIIDRVNASGADFLVAALGAQKGQLWLHRNSRRFAIPIRAHLGASLNFQAGTVKRAPRIMCRSGLEWLWRIKEEPYLWRRYWNDGKALFRLLLTRVLPLAIWSRWLRLKSGRRQGDLVVTQRHDRDCVTISLSGHATGRYVGRVIPVFRRALRMRARVVVDLSDARAIDPRFLGLLLMLRKVIKNRRGALVLAGLSPGLQRLFRLNGLDFLLLESAGAIAETRRSYEENQITLPSR